MKNKRRTIAAVAKSQPGFKHSPGSGTSGVRRVVSNVPGRPGAGLTSQPFKVKGFTQTLRPIFQKRSVRMLQKVDPAKGITSPEAGRITTTHGVDTGKGFASRAKEISKFTMVSSGRNSRVLRTPSPTGGAGVRNPFNVSKRVGRGSAKRSGSKRYGG